MPPNRHLLWLFIIMAVALHIAAANVSISLGPTHVFSSWTILRTGFSCSLWVLLAWWVVLGVSPLAWRVGSACLAATAFFVWNNWPRLYIAGPRHVSNWMIFGVVLAILGPAIASLPWRLRGFRWRGAISDQAPGESRAPIRYSIRSLFILTTVVALVAGLVPRDVWNHPLVGPSLVWYLKVALLAGLVLAVVELRKSWPANVALLTLGALLIGLTGHYVFVAALTHAKILGGGSASPFSSVSFDLVTTFFIYAELAIIRWVGYDIGVDAPR